MESLRPPRPSLGSIVIAWFNGNTMQRKVRILAYDNDGLAYVSYPEYNLPNEWIKQESFL